MNSVHIHARWMEYTAASLVLAAALVGCASQPVGDADGDALQEIGGQINPDLGDALEEPPTGGYGIPRVEAGDTQGTYIGAHETGHSFLGLVDEYVEGGFEDMSIEESPPQLIPDAGPCPYSATRNVNCRVSDYPESSLVSILMQGEAADLLYLNPTYTHGKFELPDSAQCWIPLALMEGPSDPLKMCPVYVVEPPPLVVDPEKGSRACSSGLVRQLAVPPGGPGCLSALHRIRRIVIAADNNSSRQTWQWCLSTAPILYLQITTRIPLT